MDFMDYVQGKNRHSVNVLVALYELTRKARSEGAREPAFGKKEVCGWIERNLNTVPADSTYTNRKEELAALGLVQYVPLDRMRNRVRLTPKGEKYAAMLAEFLEKVREAAEEQK